MRTQLVILVALAVLATPAWSGCFPLSRTWGSGPNGMALKDWWCGADQYYGFLGFSYPVEDDNCGDYSYNGFLADFNNMKKKFNASIVRTYLPVCRQTGFWVNMIKAARDANMGLIPQIFWDWQENDKVMNEAENAFLGVFSDSEVGKIAAYVVQSVAFGDELGEQGTSVNYEDRFVGQAEAEYWLSRMQTFKSKLSPHGVPISMTDDWDRGVYKNGNGLSGFGQQVNALSDLTHAHIMPYYHPQQCPDAYHFWPYFTQQMNFLTANNKRPIFITQTLWAYDQSGHHRGSHDSADNMQNYQQYWNTINDNCQTFKNAKIGWFIHSYRGEPGLDMVNDQGNAVYNFKPKMC